MIASALVSKRCRDCLHQTPIEAQPPPQSGGAGPQARGRFCALMPSHLKSCLMEIRRYRSVVRGLGGGAGQSSSTFRDPDRKTERERVSNPSDALPGSCAMDPECARRRTGLPEGKTLDGSTLLARIRRRAHPLPSITSSDREYESGEVYASFHITTTVTRSSGKYSQSRSSEKGRSITTRWV